MLSCSGLRWMPATAAVWCLARLPCSCFDPRPVDLACASASPLPRPRPARSIFQSLAIFANFPYCSDARLAPSTNPRCISCFVFLCSRASLCSTHRHRHQRARSDLVIILDSDGVTVAHGPPLVPAFFRIRFSLNFTARHCSAAHPSAKCACTLIRASLRHRLFRPDHHHNCRVAITTNTSRPPSTSLFATIDILTRRRPLRWFNTQQKDGSYQADSPKVHGW